MEIKKDKITDTSQSNDGAKSEVKNDGTKDESKKTGKPFSSKGASMKNAWKRTKTNVAKLAQMEMIKRANRSKKKKLVYQGRWVYMHCIELLHNYYGWHILDHDKF